MVAYQPVVQACNSQWRQFLPPLWTVMCASVGIIKFFCYYWWTMQTWRSYNNVLPSPFHSSSSRKYTSHGALHMNIKALCSFETSVAFYQSTRRNISEYLKLHQLYCQNQKSRKRFCGLDAILTWIPPFEFNNRLEPGNVKVVFQLCNMLTWIFKLWTTDYVCVSRRGMQQWNHFCLNTCIMLRVTCRLNC